MINLLFEIASKCSYRDSLVFYLEKNLKICICFLVYAVWSSLLLCSNVIFTDWKVICILWCHFLQASAPAVDPDYVKKQLKNQKQMNEDIAVMRARLRDAAADAQRVTRALGDEAGGQNSLLANKIEVSHFKSKLNARRFSTKWVGSLNAPKVDYIVLSKTPLGIFRLHGAGVSPIKRIFADRLKNFRSQIFFRKGNSSPRRYKLASSVRHWFFKKYDWTWRKISFSLQSSFLNLFFLIWKTLKYLNRIQTEQN